MNPSIIWGAVTKAIAVGMTGLVLGTGAIQLAEVEPEPIVEEPQVLDVRVPGAELTGDVVIRDLTEEKPSEPSETPSEPPSQPQAPSVPSTPAKPTQTQFTSIYDFEEAYMGVCPKDVPEGVWPSKLSPLVALGYSTKTAYDLQFTPETKARQIFHLFRSGQYSDSKGFVATVDDMGVVFSKTEDGYFTDGRYVASHSGYRYWVEWATLTIYLDETGAYIPINDEQRAEMQRVAEQMTRRLRELDAQYTAKCGV